MVKKNDYNKRSFSNNRYNSNRSYNYSNRNYRKNYGYKSRYSKPRADETVDDIKQDIIRIEKEIKLELKEIRSMKLGI